MEQIERLILIGFSGTGKSSAARLVGQRLGWDVVDLDTQIEDHVGKTIPQIFEQDGEAAFRQIERAKLIETLNRQRVVVACGGGATVDPVVWSPDLLCAAGTVTVALDAQPDTVLDRLRVQQGRDGDSVVRPLLLGIDPLSRIREIKSSRQDAYDRATITLIVDRVDVGDVAAEVVGMVGDQFDETMDIRLNAFSGSSTIVIQSGVRLKLGPLIQRHWPTSRTVWIVTDDLVGALHAEATTVALEAAGFAVRCLSVPSGEGSKRLPVAESLFDGLLQGGVERQDLVVALGGGMIGDLAGFVAATCLRGLGLVQVPTTLLAMVDSSVGGKTGVNHPSGKNLIGAFYQPSLVVIDTEFLSTLPDRELSSGWAEIVKHAVIQRSTPGGERNDLARFIVRNGVALKSTREPAMSYLVRRNVALKAAVVAEDEREAGIRAVLNFGHTIGHGIEAARYSYLHGEAVAVGMRAETRLGNLVGTCGIERVQEIDKMLDQFSLPAVADVDSEQVLTLMRSDKKRVAGRQRWVLPESEGGVVIREDVSDEVVRMALDRVIRRKTDPDGIRHD